MHESFSTLFDFLPIGAYRTSSDGRQLRANRALAALNGFDTEAEQVAAFNVGDPPWYVQPGRRDEFLHLLERDGFVVGFVGGFVVGFAVVDEDDGFAGFQRAPWTTARTSRPSDHEAMSSGVPALPSGPSDDTPII